jgi:hypothetical protein
MVNFKRRLGSALLLLSLAFSAESARAQTDQAMPDQEHLDSIFSYGQGCESLTQLSRVELVGITHDAYSENFALFCKPDNVYRCDEYTPVLAGLGRLEDNGRGSCRYLPNAD